MRNTTFATRRILLSSLVGGLGLRNPSRKFCGAKKAPIVMPTPVARAAAHRASQELTLILLGDVMLGRCVDDEFGSSSRKTQAFGSVLLYINQFDQASTIVAGNLECAVTQHAVAPPKAFNFKLSPGHADVLKALQLSYVSLANNHVLDYGQEGLQETHQVLDQLGVAHSGSGPLPYAAQPAFVRKGGYQVAFLSYADHYEEWAASTDTPGINFINPASFVQALLQHQVAAARAQGADLVLVFIHWGPNWSWQPDTHLQQLGACFLEAGADLVFGHSAHHIQGVQLLGRKPIIYGAGGFIDDYAVDSHYHNDLGCMWLASFAPKPTTEAAAQDSTGMLATEASIHGHAHDFHNNNNNQQRDPIGSSSGRSSRCPGVQKGMAVAGSLQLQSLKAVPLFIHQDWREGVQWQEPGHGNPPYFSQVDLAQGACYAWVANKLQQLSAEFGTSVVQLPAQSGLLLVGGALQQ